MLIQLLSQHPQAAGTIVAQTPAWVWGLLAALVALGLSQWRDRQASVARVTTMPVAMTLFSAQGVVSAFGASGHLPLLLGLWATGLVLTLGVLRGQPAPAGSRYNATSQRFYVPGGPVPLVLILGIFFTKYLVGVELNLQAQQAQNPAFAAPVVVVYGFFSGVFVARSLALLRLRGVTGPTSEQLQTA